MKYLVIFHTFSGVMQLEKFLKKEKIKYETMPAPRALSVDCGVSIVFEYDYKKVLETVKTENIFRIYEYESQELVYEND